MTLPKLTIPLYDVTLPSGTKVTFRPFLVKEEKLLLIAKQANDAATMVQCVKQIIQNCLSTTSVVNVDKLPLFDLEYLFLHLRARSIGEVVTVRYKCNQANGANTCGIISEYPIDLLTIQPKFGEGHSKTVKLTENVGLTMTYPSFKSFTKLVREDLHPDEAYGILLDCIESIYDERGVYYTKDVPRSELQDFVDTLSPEQVKKIDHFFDTIPKIETTIHFECPKCQHTEEIVVEGLDSFFV